MAYNITNGGTKIPSPLIPSGNFATHIANLGEGGYQTVSSKIELNAVPTYSVVEGSVFYVIEEDTEYRATISDGIITWNPIKNGGLSEEDAAQFAKLDQSDGKILESQSRAIIFRGSYIDEVTFNSVSGDPHARLENAIYIDNNSGKIYYWSEANGKFQRDSIYWQEIV